MEIPGLAENGGCRNTSIQHRFDIAVFFNTDAWLAGRTKGGDSSLPELKLGGLPEKLQIFGVAARPSAFNISYTQIVQLAGYLQLVINSEG